MSRVWKLAGILLALAPLAHAGTLSGTWTVEGEDHGPDRLQMSMHLGPHEQDGMSFPRSAFVGLDDAALRSTTATPVQFALRREAGAIAFEGTFRDGQGVGRFTFTPNHEFPAALQRLGVTFDTKGEDDDHRLFHLAVFDVNTAFIRSMQAIGYDEPLDRYVEFRIFDVTPAYVHDMADVGFPHLTAAKLVETRIHGATPDYIRDERAHGQDLTLDQYIESRIFRVTPEFADEMRRAGYPGLSRQRLVEFRIHDVTPEFIRQFRELGYDHIPAEKLVEMRIQNVTPEFVRTLEDAGYHHVPIDKMVQMRIFDIDPKMVRALDDADRGGRDH